MPSDSLFLRACRGEPVSRPPVWMMRQAGRYLPEYRAIREKTDFLTLCKNPPLAAEVTLQPIDILGVDAAVIFSDILVLLEVMGLPLKFGRDHGPLITSSLKSEADIQALSLDSIPEKLAYVHDTIRLVRSRLEKRNIPVIGFAGAPFTLACYAIEGESSHDFSRARRMMQESPGLFTSLLNRLADGIGIHLQAQIEAGAEAVQLFDTWAGLLSRDDYLRFGIPAIQRSIKPIRASKTPVILYARGSTPHLNAMKDCGVDVLSVDWSLPLSEVRKQVGDKIGLQGNLDPTCLYAPPQTIRESVLKMLKEHPGPRWIANLGHGIQPDTPVEHAKTFVKTIQEFVP